MKKQNFKRFWKEYGGVIGGILWIFLFSSSIVALIDSKSIWLKLGFIAAFIIYTVIGCKIIVRSYDKEQIEKEEAREKKLQKLKIKYKSYIELIDNEVQDILDKSKKEFTHTFEVDTSFEYLIYFENIQKWLCENDIVGKPDSFIIASCVMYSLIKHPIITIKEAEDVEELDSFINLTMGMNLILKMISEPSTYCYNYGVWKEEKHPKVNIVISDGIIKDSKLYDRILNTLYWDELTDIRTSIIQFSNVLHLVYLNCQ